ncbi:MAG: Imidazoleglycerol-phosphate synthase HisH [uncultured bacterium]|nr:MAG: Imidazoleglycerol-phosphate synthase HisH [uncultured bacterium]OGT56419.1 MAG: imidazole glycerol phosphate synthase, glutamine amidotransferase subunit [Gammaproteobacteria bacterium RIFCSPHIGHO2_12_FULL_42_10]
MNVVIVDYGMGNIHSLIGALRYIGVQNVTVSDQYQVLKNADKLILPGVGAFYKAMQSIKEKKLDQSLYDLVINNYKPILGICLGMQLMCLSSTEQGEHAGLGFIKGTVRRLNDNKTRIPHVGFNQVLVDDHLKLYRDMTGQIDFYFTHSFKAETDFPINQCHCHYGDAFIASYEADHIAGVQFHPELSQKNGLKLLKNFVEHF